MPDTVTVQTTDGRKWDIPRANLSKAIDRGAKLVTPYAGFTPGHIVGEGVSEGAGAVGGLFKLAKDVANPTVPVTGSTHRNPQTGNYAIDPKSLLGEFTEGLPEEEAKAKELWNQPGIASKVQAAGHELASYVPFVGPAAASHADQILEGDIGGGLSRTITDILFGKALEKTGDVAKGAADAVRKTSSLPRELVAPESSIEQARKAHTEKMAEIQTKATAARDSAISKYRQDLKDAADEHQRTVNETEGNNAQKEAAYRLKVEQIKSKYAEDVASQRQAWRDKVSGAQREYENKISGFKGGEAPESQKATAADIKKRTFTQPRSGPVYQRVAAMADRIAETEVPKLDKSVREAYNARWNAWRQAMGPGAEVDFSPVQRAVSEAEDSILKGSPENIAIFRNILNEGVDPMLQEASVFKGGRGINIKDIMGSSHFSPDTLRNIQAQIRDLGEPEATGSQRLRPDEAVNISVDDARGYVQELQRKRMTGRVPSDVYRALKYVEDAGEGQVRKSAQERGTLSTYNRLKQDWSQYMSDFYDSDGALTKLKNAVNSDQRLNLVSGSEGSRIVDALGRYAQFSGGADLTDLAGRVRSIMKQLREMPSTAKAPERGEMPAAPEPKAGPTIPAPPELKALPDYVELPELKLKDMPANTPFSREDFIRGQAAAKAAHLNNLTPWEILAIGAAVREMAMGNFPWALSYPITKRAMARALSNPQFVEWMTRH